MSNNKKLFLAGVGCALYAVTFAQAEWPLREPVIDTTLTQELETGLSNKAPAIIYRNKPAELVWIDGEPSIIVDQELRMYRIGNTPHLIIKNHNDDKFYLYSGRNKWYVSDSATYGYSFKNFKLLPGVIKLMDSLVNNKQRAAHNQLAKTTTSKTTVSAPAMPEIVVVQQPSELIYTIGEPVFINFEGSSLSYVKNSPHNLFRDSVTNTSYILIAGRWFASAQSFEGPWIYTPSDKLPEAFQHIPGNSEKSGVLAHITGTKAAQHAIGNAKLLYVTKVKQHTDSSFVVYDGGAEFGSFSNTGLFIAENSNVPVLNYREKYYALKDGVWFKSNEAMGPWQVSTTRPPEIDKIPPTHKLYYTRFVYIKDTTENYITTGYTAGYFNTYIQNNAIVYGTGWEYKPWYRQQFFICPLTWNSGVKYYDEKNWTFQSALQYYKVKVPGTHQASR